MKHAMQIPFSIQAAVKVRCYQCSGLIGTMRREVLLDALAVKGELLCPACNEKDRRYSNLIWCIENAVEAIAYLQAEPNRRIDWLVALLRYWAVLPMPQQGRALEMVEKCKGNRTLLKEDFRFAEKDRSYNNLLWTLIDRAENALFHEGAKRQIFWLHALLFHFHTIPVESQLKMAGEALDIVTAHAANQENGIPSDNDLEYLSCSPKVNKSEPDPDGLERWELDRNSVFEGWQGGAWDE